jgi:hypothetical protein
VPTNYHTLSDFRTAHGALLDQLLTQSVATLMHADLANLNRVAQDGMRVRASAGAARQRAAQDRRERVRKALEELPEVEAKKKSGEKEKARVSTTDPEARVMKMGDGGFRPAYNVQLATDALSQVIVGVEVVNSPSDQGQLVPMVKPIEERYQESPKEMLLDGGFVKKEAIEQVSPPEGGTLVYAPGMESKDPQRDRHTPCDDDSPAVAEWRVRMGTPEAKEIYKERAATAECVNAISRNRGLRGRFPAVGGATRGYSAYRVQNTHSVGNIVKRLNKQNSSRALSSIR